VDRTVEKGSRSDEHARHRACHLRFFVRETLPPLTISSPGSGGAAKLAHEPAQGDLTDFGFCFPVWFKRLASSEEEHFCFAATSYSSTGRPTLCAGELLFSPPLDWIGGWKHRFNLLLCYFFLSLAIGSNREHHAGEPFGPIHQDLQ